jgi:hypothetical protein
MAPVRPESLFDRHATTTNNSTNRHKKARRGKSLRYRDFIGKSVACIKIGCDAGAALTMLIFYALKIGSLRSIPTGSSNHDIIERHAIRRAAQLLEELRPSKSSGDASQRVQLRTLIFF